MRQVWTSQTAKLRCPTALQDQFARIHRVPLCRDRDRSIFATKLRGLIKRVVKERARRAGWECRMYISLFNADRGRIVAATAIPFDIATGGEAEVCGKVNSYDFAEPCSANHQQNSSFTAADVNEGRSWDHFLAAPPSFRKTRSKRRLYHRSQAGEAAPEDLSRRQRSTPRARPKFDHRKQK